MAEPQQTAGEVMQTSTISSPDCLLKFWLPDFLLPLLHCKAFDLYSWKELRKMADSLNCTFIPSSTPTDAGVAGAGVSFLY
jgi:hypothetical protein